MLTISYTIDGLRFLDPTKILPDHDCKTFTLSPSFSIRETEYTTEGGFNTWRDSKGVLMDDYSLKIKAVLGWCYAEEFQRALRAAVTADENKGG